MNTCSPLSVVEDPDYCELAKVDRMSRKTLVKYIRKLRDAVTSSISDYLPQLFVVEYDGWSDGHGSYLVGVFACFRNAVGEQERVLLGIEPLLDETNHSAPNHVSFFQTLLGNFGKTAENIICFVCDSAAVNNCIAQQLKKPRIACKAHLLQLFINNHYMKVGNKG